MSTLLKYIERVAPGHNGPAWIARIEASSSGKTLYFNNRAFKSWEGSGVGGNYFDIETDETYWISNPKKSGQDRHRFGKGIVLVQSAALQGYLDFLGASELDERFFQVTSDIKETNKSRFHKLENRQVTGTHRTVKEIRTNKQR